MWNFLFGILFARATGISRFVRPLLWLALLWVLIAGVVYTAVVFKAVTERRVQNHVHAHSAR
jgi:hypothetical protein